MAAKKRPVRGTGRKGPDSEEKKAKKAPTTTEKQPPPAAAAQETAQENKTENETRTPPPLPVATDAAETDGAPDEAEVAAAPLAAPKFPIVGIGASAGGLEALQEFFGHMPADSGMGFVVVTHQSPSHISLLPSLLSKSSNMPVVEARDGQTVQPNHVYVGAPGGLLGIAGGVLRRLGADSAKAPHLPIDYFFRSLAVDQREHAICVVLSGTGTDGTLGVRAIKAESGMVMVQEPPSAKYAGMPASASATGLADYVLPAAAMPAQLVAYAKGPYLKPRFAAVETPSFPKEPLQRIMVLLRARTGHDFTCYKPTTIRRRIERRMNVHQIKEPPGYVRYLQENPHEIDLLFAELLISVTSFFRDPQAFEALCDKAIPDLLGARSDEHTIRAWVPGCASGEEAYSVAILLHECMEKVKRRFDVQIFGTDLDRHAIDAARVGIYSSGITADVSKERLERYFTREDGIYRIRKEIREMLVFAPQNVIRDPPFTKLDLIVCRNLLIYLDGEIQRKLLPVFHYALLSGGLLFLGPSESLGGSGELFDFVDSKWKIYRRRETPSRIHPMMELPPEPEAKQAPALPRELAGPVKHTQTIARLERLLLSRYAPTTVVVDERGMIVYIHGRTGAYLEPTEGQPRNNILEMARHGLVRPLSAALRQAAQDKGEVVRENLRVRTNGDYVTVNLAVSRIEEPETIRGLFLVTITPASAAPPASKPSRGKKEPAQPERVEELENELQYVRESLQTTIEELETSNEELKSTNEELQSTNEEMQSTNEELETSKEEMQSLNEELSTVNAELQAKVDELSRSTDDMQNLLNSTQVATVFLDNHLCVKRYTEQAKELFNLIQADIGRPLSDLSSNLERDNLVDDCRDVLRTLGRKEIEVRSRKGVGHLMRIMPYRTSENVIDGVVLTFMETAGVKQAEQRSAELSGCFESIARTTREPLAMLDAEFRLVAVNAPFCQMFRVRDKEAVGKRLGEISQGQLDIPEVRKLLAELAQQDGAVIDREVACDFPPDGRKRLRINASRLDGSPQARGSYVLAMEEVKE